MCRPPPKLGPGKVITRIRKDDKDGGKDHTRRRINRRCRRTTFRPGKYLIGASRCTPPPFTGPCRLASVGHTPDRSSLKGGTVANPVGNTVTVACCRLLTSEGASRECQHFEPCSGGAVSCMLWWVDRCRCRCCDEIETRIGGKERLASIATHIKQKQNTVTIHYRSSWRDCRRQTGRAAALCAVL